MSSIAVTKKKKQKDIGPFVSSNSNITLISLSYHTHIHLCVRVFDDTPNNNKTLHYIIYYRYH